jgi:hypothetical protein
VAYGSAAVNDAPSLDSRICATPFASVADSARLTAVDRVLGAPPLMAIVPVGALLSGTAGTGAAMSLWISAGESGRL